MNLLIIVMVGFFTQNGLCVFHGGVSLQGAGSDNPILKPAIMAIHLHFELLEHLLPLRIDLFRSQGESTPDTVSFLDKSKHAQVIDIVTKR